MSAASLILRIVFATMLILALGVIAVFGFTVVEPFANAFGSAPASLGWGSLSTKMLAFSAAGFIGLFLVVVIWLVYGAIRNDRRQGYG